jgi:drug/metabolite transporter (DMT)-like permease
VRAQHPLGGHALVALAACSWGTWSLFLRAAESRGPLAAELEALWVMGVIGLVTLPLALRDARGKRRSLRTWAVVVALGVSDALNILLFFRAMRGTTLAIAVLTHSLAPLLVAALAPFFAREPRRARTLVAAAVATFGLALLLEPWRGLSPSALAGATAGAGSAIFYATNVLVQKRLGETIGPYELMAFHAFPSCAVLALAVPVGGFAIGPAQAAILTVGALGPGAVAGVVFVAALRRVPASHAGVLALLEPFVAVVIGIAVWHEPLRPLGLVGAVLVLGALVAAVRPSPGPTRSSAAP